MSRNSEISLQCYLRADEPKRGGDGIADDMGNDVYMGGVRFTPDFDDMDAPQEQWHELSGGSGKGKVMVALAYQPSTVSSTFVCSIVTLRFCSHPPPSFCVILRLFHHIPPSDLGSWARDFWICGPRLRSHVPAAMQLSRQSFLLWNSGVFALLTLYSIKSQGPLSIDDFELITVIGKGSFGKASSSIRLHPAREPTADLVNTP